MSDIELSATVPDELPDGSVVLDRIKRAWQRRDGRWFVAGMGGPSLFGAARWSWLVVDCGPLIPLWTPPSVSADAAEPVAEPAAAVPDGQFLGLTRHGHPIGSATIPDDCPVKVPVVDCGGPAACAECGRDTVVIKELKAREIGADA